MKKMIRVILLILLTVGLVLPLEHKAYGASPSLNYTSYQIYGNYSFNLILYNNTKKVQWSSSNKKVAKVTQKGKVTSVSNGKCTITAKVGKKKYKCKVKVIGLTSAAAKKNKKDYKKTTLDLSSLTIDVSAVNYDSKGNAVISNAKKNTIQLKLYNIPKKNGKEMDVSWRSSRKKIAKVDKKGVVTPVKKGKCIIYATVKGKTYRCNVKVTNMNKTVKNKKRGDINSAAEKIDTQTNIYKHLQLLNDARLKKKIAPLKINSTLNKVAKIRVMEIVPKDLKATDSTGLALKLDSNFAHARPDGTAYKTAFDQVHFSFPSSYSTGENIVHTSDIAKTLGDVAQEAFTNLWNSTLHKKNMLRKDYTTIGIGYYKAAKFKSSSGRTYIDTFWTQEFFGV